MIVKILGIIDLFVAVLFLALKTLPRFILLAAAAYLLIKGFLFVLSEDFASYADIVIGIYFILASFGITIGLVSILFAFFLAQKGLLSLI